MPHIELRFQQGSRSPNDLLVSVQDATYNYLLTSPAAEIRVSAYLDRDCPLVEANYEQIFVHEECQFNSKILKLIPGSRSRKNINLPGPMNQGEQLVIIVSRSPLAQ